MRVSVALIILTTAQLSVSQHLPLDESAINFASYFCFLLYSKNLSQISKMTSQSSDLSGSEPDAPEAKQMRDVKMAGLLLSECKLKASFLPDKALFEALQRVSNGIDEGFLPVFFPSLTGELSSLSEPLNETETAILTEFQSSRAYSPTDIAKLFERKYIEVMGLNNTGTAQGMNNWFWNGKGSWVWAVTSLVFIVGAIVLFAQFTGMKSQVIEIEALLQGKSLKSEEKKEAQDQESTGKEKEKSEGDVKKRRKD